MRSICGVIRSDPENLLQFEGQTKEKLGTPAARGAVDNVIGEQMLLFTRKQRKQSDAGSKSDKGS